MTLRGARLGRADLRDSFFDTCKTLKVRDTRIKKFLSDTGAKAVIGYTKDVEWIASAAFELMIFEAFCYRTQMRAVKNMLWTNYPGMVKKLGMKFEYRCSDLRPSSGTVPLQERPVDSERPRSSTPKKPPARIYTWGLRCRLRPPAG